MKSLLAQMGGMNYFTKLFLKRSLVICNVMMLSSLILLLYANTVPLGSIYISLINHSKALYDTTLPALFFTVFGTVFIEEAQRKYGNI